MDAKVLGTGSTIAEALENARQIAAQGFEVEPRRVRCIGASARSDVTELRDGLNRLTGITITWQVEGTFDVPPNPLD